MTSELYTKKILLGKLREKTPSESDAYTMQTCILQPRIFRPLVQSRHVVAGLTYAWYKSNNWLVFATQSFFGITLLIYSSIHLSQWLPRPFLLTISTRGPTRTVVKAYYLTLGVSFTDSRFSSSLSDTVKSLTVYLFLIRLLLQRMGTPSLPCGVVFVPTKRIESQSLNGLRTVA